jgi:uncharacterized protein (DUF983 family)
MSLLRSDCPRCGKTLAFEIIVARFKCPSCDVSLGSNTTAAFLDAFVLEGLPTSLAAFGGVLGAVGIVASGFLSIISWSAFLSVRGDSEANDA